MSWLDRFKAKRAATETRQAAPQMVRRFDGAAGGRRGSGMGTFGPVNSEVAAAGPQLRARARYLVQNNTWINHAVANWVGALVGSGIVPTAAPDSLAVFNTWAATADADGLTDFWGLQATLARAMVTDGEVFAQVIDGPDGPQYRAIPAELVDESMTRPLDGGGFIINGIEFDAGGRRAAFYVFPSKPTDLFQTYAPPIRIPASEMLHIFRPLAPGQVRGVSWLAPVILGASDFDQLCDALLVGVKTAAMFAGFLTNMNDTGGADPFGGDDQPSLEPGTMQKIPGGWDVKFTSPQQAQQVQSFIRLNLQSLAAGLGLPEHLLSGDLSNANYSSLRAGLLPFRQRVEAIQYHTLVPQFLGPVWREVITWAAAKSDLPGFEDDPRAALAVEWLPPRPLQVDPVKDTEATILEIENGLTSRKKAVAERGWNLADLDAEIAADTFQPRTAAAPKKDAENA